MIPKSVERFSEEILVIQVIYWSLPMNLSATTRIQHGEIAAAMERLTTEHEDYVTDAYQSGRRWGFETPYGRIAAELRGPGVDVRVDASDDSHLCYMKMMVLHHLNDYLGTELPVDWMGDRPATAIPPFFREARVQSSRAITPHMRRVVFAGDDLARFAEGGMHIRLIIPPAGRMPVWPTLRPDGLLGWPSGDDAHSVRIYTIQALDLDAGTLAVDFVLHPGSDGPGAQFAEHCLPGTVVGLLGPGGGDDVPSQNCLLLGDDTALPAIANLLAQLPATAKATVLLEVDAEADRYPLVSKASLDIRWIYRRGRPAGATGLLPAALAAIPEAARPDGLYVWSGSEFEDFREIRRILRKEWKLPKVRHIAVAYWRRGAAGEEAVPHEH